MYTHTWNEHRVAMMSNLEAEQEKKIVGMREGRRNEQNIQESHSIIPQLLFKHESTDAVHHYHMDLRADIKQTNLTEHSPEVQARKKA